MNFGQAIELVKSGKRVARAGWNGKGMYIYLRREDDYDPCLVMYTAQRTLQPGWLASQADILADDWCDLGVHPAVNQRLAKG